MKSKLLLALLLLAPLLPFAAETNAPVKIFGVVLQKTAFLGVLPKPVTSIGWLA